MTTAISVIIPTYRRRDSLLKAVSSLQEQSADDFEITVIDNAGDPELQEALAAFNSTARLAVRCVEHLGGGLSGARNRGVIESRGELLLFTDDDLTFDRGWVDAFGRHFDTHPDMDAAGGCVRPIWETPPAPWLLEYIDRSAAFGPLALMDLGPDFLLSAQGFFFGCNMALRRHVFEWTGFHPELFGKETVGDGEAGLGNDVLERGGLIGYVPEALAYHHVPAARMSVDYICRWAWHQGAAEMFARWRKRDRGFLALLGEVIWLIRRYRRAWLEAPRMRHRTDPTAIDTRFEASLGLCKLHYVWRMLVDARVREALSMKSFRPRLDE